MSLVETVRNLLPKGYQPDQEEIAVDALFQKMRLDCEGILKEEGTRVPHKLIRLLPFIYGGAVLYRLTPWQVGDGIKLTAILEDPEDVKERLTITLESRYVSDPKKAPSLILRAEEADTYLVIYKDSAIIRDEKRTVRNTNRKDAETYRQIINILKHPPQT